MTVRLLVLPVFRNYWLYHVLEAPQALQHTASKSWQDGSSIQEKLQLLGRQAANKVQSSVAERWRQVETAKDGTFKNRLYRLAQFLLSREEPLETFLKSLPNDCATAEIIYPASLNSVVVRRRTRKIASLRAAFHQRYMLIPLPNVLSYYTFYKVYSHYQARNGAAALNALFKQRDAQQQQQMQEQVVVWARSGIRFEPGSWPHALQQKDQRHKDLVAGLEEQARQQLGLGAAQEAAMQPRLVPDDDLDAIIQPLERLKTPISDKAVQALSEKLDLPHLAELVGRVKRLAERSQR